MGNVYCCRYRFFRVAAPGHEDVLSTVERLHSPSVEFEIGQGQKGPQALDVRAVQEPTRTETRAIRAGFLLSGAR